jgi:hypothetical protein
MPPVSEKTGDESDPNNTAGKGSADAADPKEAEGLKAALLAEREKRQDLASKLARLEGTVEGLKARPAAPEAPPRIWTRAELRALVDGDKITEEQMDAQLDAQLEAKLERKFAAKMDDVSAETRVTVGVDSQISAYIEAHPDLTDTESDLRKKVQTEFDYLVGVCGDDPKDKRTELKAIRSAVGALAPKGRKKEPEASEETGGSDGVATKGGGGDDGWAKGLTPAQKAYYKKKIDQNFYKGTTDKNLLAEVAIARKTREQKALH